MKQPMALLLTVLGIFLGMGPLSSSATTLVLGEESTFHDILFTTEKPQAGLATAMVKGDFNRDGIDDIAMGAIREAAPRTTDEVGMVTVFLGGPSLFALTGTVLTGKESDGAEYARIFDPTIPNDWFGVLMAVGDLDGNGSDDLVIAAQSDHDDDSSSKIYIVYGETIAKSGDIALIGQTLEEGTLLFRDTMHVGALATGDLNRDGVDDLIISDIMTSSTKHLPMKTGHTPNGSVYIVFGGSDLPSQTIDLKYSADEASAAGIDKGADTILTGVDEQSVLQVAGVAVGDLNNDRVDDLTLGVPKESNASYGLENAGRVYVLFGSSEFPTGRRDIDSTQDVVIYGGEENDEIGGTVEVTDYNDSSLAIGDINGDRIGDLIIGAPRSMLGQVNSTGMGKVEVLFGRTDWRTTYDLYDGYDIRLTLSDAAQRIGVETGYAVAVADVNGDNQGDLLIGSHHAMLVGDTAPAGHYYNGILHVIYGGSDIQKDYSAIDKEADILISTENPTDKYAKSQLAQTFMVGNFDNGGNPDILVGAPKGIGPSAETSAGWAIMLFDAASKSGGASSGFCPQFDVANGYALSIPSISIEGVSGALGIKLIPDETLMNWTLVDYWPADVDENTLPLSSDLTLHVPCADLGIAKIAFSMTLNLNTLQFVLNFDSITPL